MMWNLETEHYVLFLTNEFSQWHPADFISAEGVLFNCTEQYMMYQKAMLFGDRKTAEAILDAKTPHGQKILGRQVNGFDQQVWEANAKRIVYEGNYYKFTQNPDLFEILKNTGAKLLVEAAPHDPVWGIGLQADDPLALDQATWKGKNWLGFILTAVRDDLLNGHFEPTRRRNNKPTAQTVGEHLSRD